MQWWSGPSVTKILLNFMPQISSTGNATDFGDLTDKKKYVAWVIKLVDYFAGGYKPRN